LLHPYFFGAWLGDGTTTKGCITYAEPDRAVLDKIISLGYQVSSHHIHKTTGVLTDYIKDSAPALKKLGVLGNKFIPDEYLFSSVAQRKELLAGLIDTDGSLDKKGRVRIGDIFIGSGQPDTTTREITWIVCLYHVTATISINERDRW